MPITSLSPLSPNVPVPAATAPESPAANISEALPKATQNKAVSPSSQPQGEQIQQLDFTESVEQMQAVAQAFGLQVHFSVDNASHQVIIQVYDANTQQVIREIPPRQIVSVLSRILDTGDAKGILLDEQA